MKLKSLFVLLFFSLVLKAGYLLVFQAEHGTSTSLYESYIGATYNNDTHWYYKIANEGYSMKTSKEDIGYSKGPVFKQSEWAFFPFYPWLNAATMKVTGLSFSTSAFFWSMLFSTLCLFLMYWLGFLYFKDETKALWTSLFLFSFPYSFYFSMMYTEAIYLAFTLACFLAIYYKKWGLLFALLIPLALVRPNGIFMLIPLYLYYLHHLGMLNRFKFEWRQIFSLRNVLRSFAFLSAPIAFLAYGIYQYKMTGYFFAFSIAQQGWYREFMFPLLAFFRRGDLATQFNSVYTILIIIFAIWHRKKLPLHWNVLLWIGIILPLCSGSVMSMTRFVIVLFPLFFIVTEIISRSSRKYLTLVVFLTLHFLSFYTWVINHTIAF